jgi:toxin-antitoxin system PIN domain toxin
VIIPDAKLLIYAHDALCPQHARARDWWEQTLSGRETIGIPWVVVLAFTRLMTHPQICMNPLTVGQVHEIIDGWMKSANVRIIQVSERALAAFFGLLEDAGMGGNLCTDALIALHAREHSAVVYSTDRDFDRFRGLRWVNPLQ